jgi:hypothetical protein
MGLRQSRGWPCLVYLKGEMLHHLPLQHGKCCDMLFINSARGSEWQGNETGAFKEHFFLTRHLSERRLSSQATQV